MKITIASGKGGTGKTTVALSLASVFSNYRKELTHLYDCDVDAANVHLFVQKEPERNKAALVQKPWSDPDKCKGCGACQRACRYNAITVLAGHPLIFDELCHSCGACEYACPENAISFTNKSIGSFHSINQSGHGFGISWGELFIGEVQAPEMIKQLKQMSNGEKIGIYDASPGAGCPVRETMIGSDAVVLVTEPTPFGLNDLRMAAALAAELGIPTGIVVNRSRSEKDIISEFSAESGIPLIGRIPFGRHYAETCSEGKILTEEHPDLIPAFREIIDNMMNLRSSKDAKTGIRVTELTEQPIYNSANSRKPDNTKEFVIMSGKGGTGKTTLSAALAGLTKDSLFFDADVDASNLPILLKGKRISEKRFIGGQKAAIDPEKCIHCNACVEACHFNAISDEHEVIPEACEGCGFCTMVCPQNAIAMRDAETGYVFLSEGDKGPVSHAFLHIGEENSGKLVSQVRDQANALCAEREIEQILGDGPPGTGCPVIAATTGADMAIIVTEPSMSGVHDMMRAADLAKHFELRAAVVINKADMNPEQNKRIHTFCEERGIPLLGEIPFDETVEQALTRELSIMEFTESKAALAIQDIYRKLRSEYNMK